MTREQLEEIAKATPRTFGGILAALTQVAASVEAERHVYPKAARRAKGKSLVGLTIPERDGSAR